MMMISFSCIMDEVPLLLAMIVMSNLSEARNQSGSAGTPTAVCEHHAFSVAGGQVLWIGNHGLDGYCN